MNVLIVGGTGFIGRAILTARPWADARYTVFSRDETKHEAVQRRWPDVRGVVGDARDADALVNLMHGFDVVIDAHAIKYVDVAEHNVSETIAVNVGGTEAVLRASARAGVGTVVFISTDKAAAPLNCYGATKQLGERLVGEYALRWPDTRFVAARYGNVVGSTGSVLWKWSLAIERGEAVQVTDPLMSRFWMAPTEAVAAIEHAANRAPSGTVTIPHCRAMRMGDVARAMGADDVQVVGLRPGERMHEWLYTGEEGARIIRDGEYAILRPAYEPARSGELERGYTSAAPRAWVEAPELRVMVEEARALW